MRQTINDIDSDLLRQVAQGNTDAFSILFHSTRNKLYCFVYSLCASRQQAEDIVQDVFTKIWQMREDLHTVRNFEHYLFRMSRNHCINILRRKMRERVILSELAMQDVSIVTEQQLQHRETEKMLQTAIDQLPQKQKQVFLLSREEGMDQEQISRQLNIAVSTVKSHMTQALRSLRSHCKSLYPVAKILAVIAWLQ